MCISMGMCMLAIVQSCTTATMTVTLFVISIGVRVTSPSSVAEDLSDGASVKKAGRRGTKSATAQRTSSVQRGKNLSVLAGLVVWLIVHVCRCTCDLT